MISRPVVRRALRATVRWPITRPRTSRYGALTATERLGGFIAALGSVEYLRGGSQLGARQLNDADTARSDGTPQPWRSLRAVVSSRRVARSLHVSRVVVGTALLAPIGGRLRALGTGHLALTSYAIQLAEPRGLDGSDEAALAVQAAAALGRARGRPADADAALRYLTLQSALSYAASGVAKLLSPTWTGGEALVGVLRTSGFGNERVWRGARRHPRLSRVLTRSVIGAEILLPGLLVGGRGARAYVLLAGVFHGAVALVMGLGRFTFAFAGMYPGVLYVSSPNDGTRSNRLPAIAAVIAAGIGAATMTAGVVDARRVRASPRPTGRLAVPSGNVVAYYVDSASSVHSADETDVGRPDTDGPIVVIEAGLAASAMFMRDLALALTGRGLTVVTYDRPGSPPHSTSRRVPFAAMPDDLATVAAHVAGDRPVVLVGHSLGGPIVLGAAPLVRHLAGVVLLDPSHPEHRPRLAAAAELSHRVLAATEATLRLGFGRALETPRELESVEPSHRRLLAALARHPSTWRAMRSELGEYLTADLAEHGVRPDVVVTAGGTAALDAAQLDADRRLASPGVHLMLPGVGHLSMVLAPAAVAEIADAIASVAAGNGSAADVSADGAT